MTGAALISTFPFSKDDKHHNQANPHTGTRSSIAIEPTADRVVVTVGGCTIADTKSALTLRKAAYPGVHYIPRSDVDMSLLEPTKTVSYCPYKGGAAYFSIILGEDRRPDAIWTYEAAYGGARIAAASSAWHSDVFPTRNRQADAMLIRLRGRSPAATPSRRPRLRR